jgi:hypothetical protein
MQSTTTKRQCHRRLHGLGLIEQQPTLAANSLSPIRPAYATERFRLLLVFPPETSIDRRAENTDSDVQHVPVIGRPTGGGSRTVNDSPSDRLAVGD